jgi:hypothetical protein
MSDSGDKPRQGGERGPLPRTNRPRPEPAKRQPAREGEGAPPSTEAGSISVRLTKRSLDVDALTEAAPPTERDPSENHAPETAAFVQDEGAMMAERPTQLDTGRSARSAEPGGLKQVPLLRADGTSAVAAEDGLPASTYVGCVIDGRYRIEGVLGRGGMGVVYRARHEIIDKLFAVKILLPTGDTEVVERFVNEARAATAIGNAHIVDTVDFGALPDGSTYFVMEYLEGQTLARRIKADGFISVSRTIAVGKQIAEGMSAAHRAGIVHRDLKPENIFLTRRDEQEDFVKLLDFGIAKIESTQNRITRAGTIFGTPHYMSPEQASGAEVDARTDVYAVGVIFYEMLSGRVPFDAENPMGLLTQHLYTEPTPLGRVPSPPQPIPSGVDAIVLKCLAKKPEDRYASMSDFAADLDCVYRGEPPDALADFLARAERDDDQALLSAAKAEFEARVPRRRRGWLVAGVAAVIVAASALLFGSFAFRDGSGGRGPGAEPISSVATAASRVQPSAGERSIALVFSPIDAEVFRDGRSLGGMPVTVHVAAHETVNVELRREGFYAETVKLDGSRPVVVVRLTPIPGVQPRIPVPSGEPLEALRRWGDAGARSFAALLYAHHDAGARAHRGDRGAARGDGGTGRTPAPPPAETGAVPALPPPTPPPSPAPVSGPLPGQTPPPAPQIGNANPAAAASVAP